MKGIQSRQTDQYLEVHVWKIIYICAQPKLKHHLLLRKKIYSHKNEEKNNLKYS